MCPRPTFRPSCAAPKLGLPEVSQIDVVRHYLHLSQLNYSIDEGFYPLGSCTMKYNPKINEDAARLPGFAFTHPLQDPLTVQGNLAIMFHLQEWLKEIGGFAGVTLQPAAGAHGEFTGILIMRNVSSRSRRHQAQRDLDPRLGARHQSRLVGDERLRREADCPPMIAATSIWLRCAPRAMTPSSA